MITNIQTQKDRIYVTDIQQSVSYLIYQPNEKTLSLTADEVNPRWVSSMDILDYDTVATTDRYGNFTVLRLPSINITDFEERSSTPLFRVSRTSHPIHKVWTKKKNLFFLFDLTDCSWKKLFNFMWEKH